MTAAVNAAVHAALLEVGLDPAMLEDVVRRSLEEDLAGGEDVTSVATIRADDESVADYVARGAGTIAGMPVLAATLAVGLEGREYELTLRSTDGARVQRGDVLATVRAPTVALLTVERTSLNLLCRLSGIATLTSAWVERLKPTNAKVRDTRKTTPGLRHLEKYAVRCGGGENHRIGLHDAVLIKDNHVAAAGGVGAALDAVHSRYPNRDFVIQVEVDSLVELDEALAHGATQVMLDNMNIEDMAEAVRRVRANAPHVQLEASGGLQLENAFTVASTGVDFLAVGALTHSAPILDIALDFRP